MFDKSGREDGEIMDAATNFDYDPAYEWPGDDTSDEPGLPHQDNQSPPSRPTLRLLVSTSSILPKTKRIAILEGSTETQLGRDAPPTGVKTPRLRLKELLVSKLHATIYWDTDRSEWAIVDMGSKHGTFVASEGAPSHSSGSGGNTGVRLSAPRVASIPRTLRHLDRLALGGTTFSVHIHESGLPCEKCSASAFGGGEDEIPLFATTRDGKEGRATGKHKQKDSASNALGPAQDVGGTSRAAKKALTSLKRDLLSRHKATTSYTNNASYVDRAARRRAFYPDSGPERTTVASQPVRRQPPLVVPAFAMRPPSPVRSAPPVPLQATNVGHKLLMRQGWQPGSTLGSNNDRSGGSRLLEPLDIAPLPSRAGLGMSVARHTTKNDIFR